MSLRKPSPAASPEHTSGLEACERLHRKPRLVAPPVGRVRIGARRLPGEAQVRYRRADVGRVADSAFVPAIAGQLGETPPPSPGKPGRSGRLVG